jgi:hypothetical protein
VSTGEFRGHKPAGIRGYPPVSRQAARASERYSSRHNARKLGLPTPLRTAARVGRLSTENRGVPGSNPGLAISKSLQMGWFSDSVRYPRRSVWAGERCRRPIARPKPLSIVPALSLVSASPEALRTACSGDKWLIYEVSTRRIELHGRASNQRQQTQESWCPQFDFCLRLDRVLGGLRDPAKPHIAPSQIGSSRCRSVNRARLGCGHFD